MSLNALPAMPALSDGQPLQAIADNVARMRATFTSGKTRSYEWRMAQLEGLRRMLVAEEDAIAAALHADLGKPKLEAVSAEVLECAMNVRSLQKNLKKWMKPERVGTPLSAQPGSSHIHREPLGVVLVVAPWNYPFSLVLHPLAGALAAGNTAVVKPSEVAPHTSALIARLFPKYLDSEAVYVVEGGVPETTALLAQRFDHIFYTGNGAIGRVVMAAAAKHLTPVTLELGGKSPAIVDASADLKVSAQRVAWAKFYNCGQTCVAPDYVLVHESVHDAFVKLVAEAVRSFWGEDPRNNPDYGRIVNARHHQRVLNLIASGGRKVIGGESDVDARYIAPTLLTDVPPDAAVMQEEIFGPVLPFVRVPSIDAAIAFVTAREKPLALYVFASDARVQDRVLAETSSGGALVNHAMLHLAIPTLPFGGVGESGMGAYHGKFSFETFSHRKAVHKRGTKLDPGLVFPPYTESKLNWIRRLL